jgi:hypothetical protein
MRARVTSVDWFVSIGFAPLSFALTGPAAAALGAETTLIIAGVVPAVVTALMYVVFRMGREQPPIVRVPEGEQLIASGPATLRDELEPAPGATR